MKKKVKKLTKYIGTFVMTATMVLGAIPMTGKASPTEFIWLAKDGVARVETGLGNGDGTEGIWFVATDQNDGGKSKVILDHADPNDHGDSISDEDVKECGGISGTVTLDKGELSYNPLVDIGFNIVGVDSLGKSLVGDATDWGGLSIAYECDVPATLVLDLGENKSAQIGYAFPEVSLDKTTDGECKEVSFAWSQFKQPGWAKGDNKISIGEAVASLAAVRFRIQGNDGTVCHFRIIGIGSKDVDLTSETYSVTFDTNDGGVVAAQNVTSGDKVTKPADPTKAGYIFGGWYTDNTFTTEFDFNNAITADTTVYAKWIEDVPTTYTVTFETNGGSVVAAQNVAADNKATKPADPTKEGYTFDEWYSDSACTTPFDFNTLITADTTVYAKWNEIKYNVTFETNGGSVVAAQNVLHGKKVEKPANPTKSDYTFAGWYSDSALTNPFNFEAPITADTTAYAKWNSGSAPETYSVTFDTNDGGVVAAQNVTSGDKVTKPADPIKAGYIFGGWYTDNTFTTAFDFNTAITGNTTVYAKWNEIAEHTVTFNSKGGSAVAAQTVEHGKKVSLPTDPTKEGYTFEGWYSNSTLTTPFEFNTPITDDVMVYAKWTEKSGGNSEKNNGIGDNANSNNNNNAGNNNTTGDKKDNTTPTPVKEGTDLPDLTTGAIYTAVDSSNNEPVVSFKTPDAKSAVIKVPATVTIDGVSYKVVSVSKNAFKDNKTVTTVTIDENVETIDTNAFSGCTNLKSVKLGNKVTSIKEGAFAGNTSLKKITIPASVKSIGKNAFKGCKNLKNVTIKTTKLTKKTVGASAFKGIYKKAVVKVPKKKLKEYRKILKKVGVKGKKQKIK